MSEVHKQSIKEGILGADEKSQTIRFGHRKSILEWEVVEPLRKKKKIHNAE